MTNPTPDAALLPCAHCGSAAQHYHRSDTTGWSNTDWVSCSDDDCGVSTALEETKAEAIAAWNRRADANRRFSDRSESYWAGIRDWPRDRANDVNGCGNERG